MILVTKPTSVQRGDHDVPLYYSPGPVGYAVQASVGGAPPAPLSLSRLALSQRVSPPLRQLPSVEQERPVAMSHLALLGSLE